MIKTITAEEVIDMLRRGKEVYYLDSETKETAPLSKVLAAVPGVYLVEDSGEPIEITIPTASTHYDYGIPVEDDPEYFPEERKIDTGKVKALKLAGWSIDKIADEMGVNAAAISYHLKKMEE